MSGAAYSVTADVRRIIQDQGARRALRSAIFEIEKLGIERNDFFRVKRCLEAMVETWPNTTDLDGMKF